MSGPDAAPRAKTALSISHIVRVNHDVPSWRWTTKGRAMIRIETNVFRSGNSDAVRLPRDVTFGAGARVIVERDGDVVTVRPVRQTLAAMIANLRQLPAPDDVQEREPFEAPERAGL